MLGMPNLAHESVPVGKDEADNVECVAGARRASSIST
jgi:seryl-tRNA synthetase